MYQLCRVWAARVFPEPKAGGCSACCRWPRQAECVSSPYSHARLQAAHGLVLKCRLHRQGQIGLLATVSPWPVRPRGGGRRTTLLVMVARLRGGEVVLAELEANVTQQEHL